MDSASLVGFVVLTMLVSGCADPNQQFNRPYRTHEARVAAILAKFESNLNDTFSPDTRTYMLTELQGMNAAAKLGPEGEDAARLWDDETVRQFAERKVAIVDTLRQEIRSYDPAYIAEVTPLVLPKSLNLSWRGSTGTPNNYAKNMDFHAAYSDARMAPICASLVSTPIAWSTQYPDRAAFTFERFNIRITNLQASCDSIPRQKQKRMTQ